MNSDELSAYLSGRGIDVKPHGSQRRTYCPVHDDPSPSVDFRDGTDGILVVCRAGCATADVVAGWGLGLPDLFFDEGARVTVPPMPRPEPPADLPSEGEITAAIKRLATSSGMHERLRAWRHWSHPERLSKLGVGLTTDGRLLFPVRDAEGALIGVTRYQPDPDRRDDRRKAQSNGPRDLWPAPEFHPPGDIWLVEGENDAVSALLLGYPASGIPGAQSWRESMATRLEKASRVFVVPDCDSAGRSMAERACRDCARRGLDVRLIDLDPSRDDGWDLSDMLGEAGSDDLAQRFLNERARHAKRITPEVPSPDAGWPSPMADEAFIGLAGRIVRKLEPTVEADPIALLMHFLVAFGNAVGSSPHMTLGRRRHPCVLFALIVGRTAKARKGTAWAAVEEIMKEADPAWYEDRIVSGLASGEGLVMQVRDPVYERMRKRDGESQESDEETDDDAYVNRIVDPGVEDKRLLVVEQEFAQPLRLMRREGNPLSQFLRTLWDSGRASSMVKNNPTKTTGAQVSIIGHIVADELEREMRSVDWYNGFANRFLFACVRRGKLLPDPPIVDQWEIKEIASEVALAIEEARQANLLIFDKDAQRLWNKAYTGELSVDRYGILGAATARAEPYVARLSMLYALLDNSDLIRPQHLRAGLAVWRYCDSSARFLFANRGVGDPDADRVREALTDGPPDGMNRRALHGALGRHWKADRLDAALNRLVSAGVAVREVVETGGRRAERWRLSG